MLSCTETESDDFTSRMACEKHMGNFACNQKIFGLLKCNYLHFNKNTRILRYSNFFIYNENKNVIIQI